MINFVNRLLEAAAFRICDRNLEREFNRQRMPKANERPIEYSYLFRQLAGSRSSTILDVGTGTTALPALLQDCGKRIVAIDNVSDYWSNGMRNRHHHIVDADITSCDLDQTFDFITCISVLEHICDHGSAISNLYRLLNPGGSLVLTFPYNESHYVENVYALHEAGYGKDEAYICQVYSRKEIDGWMATGDWRLSDQEYWRVFHGALWTMGGRLDPPVRVSVDELHHLTCLTLTKQANSPT